MKHTLALLALVVLTVSALAGGLTPTGSQTRLYGTVTMFGDSLANAKVTLTLSGANYFYTSSSMVSAGENVTYTDANGRFSFNPVWGTDSLIPTGRATYTMTIEQPEIQAGGFVFQVSGLTINADGDSTDIREVLAQ